MKIRYLLPLAGLLALGACKDEKKDAPPPPPAAKPDAPKPDAAKPADPAKPPEKH